jgi:hypothetical protein
VLFVERKDEDGKHGITRCARADRFVPNALQQKNRSKRRS